MFLLLLSFNFGGSIFNIKTVPGGPFLSLKQFWEVHIKWTYVLTVGVQFQQGGSSFNK